MLIDVLCHQNVCGVCPRLCEDETMQSICLEFSIVLAYYHWILDHKQYVIFLARFFVSYIIIS